MSSLVSVIIPAYNASPFLSRSVASALSQTYENIEVVIVDDGSTDDTGAIADGLAAQDSRVKVVHQENRGLAEARRSGIKAATADYLIHLDADDDIDPIKNMPEYIELYNKYYAIYMEELEQLKLVTKRLLKPENIMRNEEGIQRTLRPAMAPRG